MTLAAPLASPFFTGAGLALDVPGKYDCALNGRVYLIDWEKTYTGTGRISRQSIPLLKPQQDTSGPVSEASLNPEEFARRAAETWHHGAGQARHDRPESDSARFRTSKGVDVWTMWQLSLLADTASKRASANTNLALVAVGARLYLVDGTGLRYTTDITPSSPTWTAVTGTSATAAVGVASDGFNVFTAHAADGIYRTDTGSGATASWNTRAANGIIAYVKGRLMVTNDNVLVNVTGTATETILLTHPNTAFRWKAITEGPGFIYAAGVAGDKSLIYKTAITQDALALASPTVAGELPDGEIIRSMQGYLGFLLVGTDKGLRLLQLDGNGNVGPMGRVIPTDSPVYCMEPQEQFVWFGLTNYDAVSTGLGRASLGEESFTFPLTPAYASDLMVTAQGTVLSVVTFQDLRVFAVSASGVYAETTDKVASGTIDSGLVGYGLPDLKVAMWLDSRFQALTGTVTHSLSSDGGSFSISDVASTAGLKSLVSAAGQARAETFEVRHSLTRSSGDTTQGPTLTRWTLEANPAPGRGEVFDVPLRLFEATDENDIPISFDPAVEAAALMSMEALGAPVTYQDGTGTYTVFVDDHEFIIASYTEKRTGFQGTYVVRLRRPRARS